MDFRRTSPKCNIGVSVRLKDLYLMIVLQANRVVWYFWREGIYDTCIMDGRALGCIQYFHNHYTDFGMPESVCLWNKKNVMLWINFDITVTLKIRIWTQWNRGKMPHHFADDISSRWRHQMETFSALLAICVENSSVTGEFPSQRSVTRSFDVFFDLGPNKRLDKQSKRWWFETPSRPLWRHCNVTGFLEQNLLFGDSDLIEIVQLVIIHHWLR